MRGKIVSPLSIKVVLSTLQLVATTATYADDFEDTGTNDYVYDEIANLIEDLSESIATINWNAYGKVESVVRSSGSGKADLEFTYDAGGNRITKTVKNGPTPDLWERTYYIRDAAGELLASYTSKIDANVSAGGNFVARFTLEEQYLYGSARLGMHQAKEELFFEEIAGTMGSDFWDYSGSRTGHGYGNVSFTRAQQTHGKVRYEISDHLGNVRSVITDRKLPTQNGAVAEFAPDVVTAQDYYPFGMLMPGRRYANASFTNREQRFHFQGQEGDDEWLGKGNAYAYKYRVSDSRIGRFFSVDPLASQYPHNSPYAFSENSTTAFVELEGLEKKWFYASTMRYSYREGPTVSKEDQTRLGLISEDEWEDRMWQINFALKMNARNVEYTPPFLEKQGLSLEDIPSDVLQAASVLGFSGSGATSGSSLSSYDAGSSTVSNPWYKSQSPIDAALSIGSIANGTTYIVSKLSSDHMNIVQRALRIGNIRMARFNASNFNVSYWGGHFSILGKHNVWQGIAVNQFPAGYYTPTQFHRYIPGSLVSRTANVAGFTNYLGRGIGVLNAGLLFDQYWNGEIGTSTMLLEQGSNYASVAGGLYGAAWGVGWEIGRQISYTGPYQNLKWNYIQPWVRENAPWALIEK